jgi:integrase
MRCGEALAITPEDIKTEGIRITKALNKASKTILTPKTKASIRTIPYNKILIEILNPYMKPGERLFNYTQDSIVKTYRLIAKETGINFTAHILRHTFVTNAYEIGIPPHIIQRWAGHAKAEQADTYLDLRNSSDFIKTEIINYMFELKEKYTPKL